MGRRKLSYINKIKKKSQSDSESEESNNSKNNNLSYAQAQKMVEISYDNKDYYLNMFDDLTLNVVNNNDKIEINNNNNKEINIFNKRDENIKLPDVNIKIIENDEYPWLTKKQIDINGKMPSNYIKYKEKTIEELDEDIEYDIDEEDIEWLKLINIERKKEELNEIKKLEFIYIMDRLEKESYFELNTNTNTNTNKNNKNEISINSNNNSDEDDAICCICLDGECFNSNSILFCDMCNLAVHQECYGVPYIPEGQWLCRKCIQSPSSAVSCILCPNKYGAFKQTDDNRWAHMICAIWIPEVHFANTVFLEPIIGIDNIEQARWKLMCYICRKRNQGACIQCDKTNCYTAFHVTCAQQAGLYMNIQDHNNELNNDVKKVAYCDIHTPIDILSPKIKNTLIQNSNNNITNNTNNNKINEEIIKREQNKRVKKARKILSEKQPTILMPKLDEITKINLLNNIKIDKKDKYLKLCINYWLLKRKLRSGVPLIRRLQSSIGLKTSSSSTTTVLFNGNNNNNNNKLKLELKEQLLYWKKLRQDLEKARLLMELIRKRERLKRDYIKISELVINYQLKPFQIYLLHILDKLKEFDKLKIFHEPVNKNDVPTYYDIIKEPMDFKTIQLNIESYKYFNFKQFENDFNLIINNCLVFNKNNNYYYKAALRLKEQGFGLFKRAKRAYDDVGYDEAGTHLEKPMDEISDSNFLNDSTSQSSGSGEIDNILNTQLPDEISLETRLQLLLNRLDLANTLKNSGSRHKWARHLKEEISVIRRKISSKMNPNKFLKDNIFQSPMKILKNRNSISNTQI